MGQLVNGEWKTSGEIPVSKDGAFDRAPARFRNWITADGAPGPSGEGGYKAEADRYHLYVSYACPWAHRTLIFRKLKGLENLISIDVVHPDMLENGWTFEPDQSGATGDRLLGSKYIYQVYQQAKPDMNGRATVPILWDKKTGSIVSNESSEIIRMFNSAFDDITGNTLDFYPEDVRDLIAPINDRIYNTLNNGVYRCGFARSQSAYDQAVAELFDTLDWLEDHLSRNRYLAGDTITEADWRLVPTLFRFDAVYHGHFKCARNRIVDFPNLWAYARELFQYPGISETVNFSHIRRHYHYSHESINPQQIIPVEARAYWMEPHNRDGSVAA